MATLPPTFFAAQSDIQSASNALLVFCRAPRLGQVKTRLAQAKGAPFALEIYRAMLRDCFDLGRGLAPQTATIATFTPADAFDALGGLSALWDGPHLAQRGEDLGARMLNALADARAQGFERCAIIGSDAPDLPLKTLRAAFDLLGANQVVIAPSADGGFVLIGASCALPDAIFADIAWSRNDVCARLMGNLRALELSYALLPAWHDVDEADDLEALRARLERDAEAARATRTVLGL